MSMAPRSLAEARALLLSPLGPVARVAVQMVTVRPSVSGGRAMGAEALRPAPFTQPAISVSEKPRRRCWCSSRSCSSAWGAKSTISRRPPGATRRAASCTAAAGSVR